MFQGMKHEKIDAVANLFIAYPTWLDWNRIRGCCWFEANWL